MADQPGDLCILEDAAQQVSVNVGGQLQTVSLQTLRSWPESNLSKTFGGNWRMQRNAQGEVFIDRNGKVWGLQLATQAWALTMLSPGVSCMVGLPSLSSVLSADLSDGPGIFESSQGPHTIYCAST